VLTWRRAVDVTLAIGILALFVFVPFVRDHRSAIALSYFAVATTVGLIRGKPEGLRFLVVSILVPPMAIALFALALWVNMWLGLACIATVPTTALVVAYRRDQRAATS
jgi:hypothetical protein